MKPNWGTVVSTTRDAVCHHCGSSSRVYGENKTIFDVRLAEFFERHKRCPPPASQDADCPCVAIAAAKARRIARVKRAKAAQLTIHPDALVKCDRDGRRW